MDSKSEDVRRPVVERAGAALAEQPKTPRLMLLIPHADDGNYRGFEIDSLVAEAFEAVRQEMPAQVFVGDLQGYSKRIDEDELLRLLNSGRRGKDAERQLAG